MSLQEFVISVLIALNSGLTGLLLFFVQGIYKEVKEGLKDIERLRIEIARHDERLRTLDDRD